MRVQKYLTVFCFELAICPSVSICAPIRLFRPNIIKLHLFSLTNENVTLAGWFDIENFFCPASRAIGEHKEYIRCELFCLFQESKTNTRRARRIDEKGFVWRGGCTLALRDRRRKNCMGKLGRNVGQEWEEARTGAAVNKSSFVRHGKLMCVVWE